MRILTKVRAKIIRDFACSVCGSIAEGTGISGEFKAYSLDDMNLKMNMLIKNRSYTDFPVGWSNEFTGLKCSECLKMERREVV